MKDDLFWNKVFGAVLGTVLVIFVLRQAAEMIFATQPPLKPGDAIAVQTAGAGETAAVADTPPDWGTVLAKADVAAGQLVSQKCLSCHSFNDGGPNQTGPNNWGIVGRAPGSRPGFAYSSAMTEFAGKVKAWDYDHLYLFLANPQGYLAGTKMSFVGLKQPQDRINLIAWLRTQSSSPAPIPPPNPKAEAAPAAAAPAAADAPAAGAAPAAAGKADAAPAAAAPAAAGAEKK